LEEDPETRHRHYRFLQGPIFSNIVLADEINRTPPKNAGSAVAGHAGISGDGGGRTYDLDLPFFVLATQNPIEQEGTYPLPEAQLDRFMFHIGIDYPSFDEEIAVVENSTGANVPQLQRVLSATKILHLQSMVRQVAATRTVVGYAVRLAQLSRPNHPEAPTFIKEWVNWGAGPRASQYLVLGAKARAIIHGRFVASKDDVRALAPSVLRHRILTNF